MQNVVLPLLTYQMQLKIYHWQTNSFSRHKASDSLGQSVATKIDLFVETLQGLKGKKLDLPKSQQHVIEVSNMSDTDAVQLLKRVKTWLLTTLPTLLDIKGEPDLMNQRDDMITDINQTLYLFTLK